MLHLLRKSPPLADPIAGTRKTTDALEPLLQEALAGNELALRTLVRAVSPKMLAVVRRLLGAHHPDVEDVAQEAAVAFVAALPRFQKNCSLMHFACRIAVQQGLSYRRAKATTKRGALSRSDAAIEELAGPERHPEQQLCDRQAAQAVRDLLKRLPPPQAEVLVLHAVAGFTIEEIANNTQTPTETVRSRLRLARSAARRWGRHPALSLVEIKI